jgi:hypothetical protein
MHAHIPVLYAPDKESKQASTIRFWIFHRSCMHSQFFTPLIKQASKLN